MQVTVIEGKVVVKSWPHLLQTMEKNNLLMRFQKTFWVINRREANN